MRTRMLVVGLGLLAALGGCPPEDYDTLVGPTLEDVDRVRNDADLDAPAKRAALADLGLTPATINTLLVGERLGNQYGGDLRTAYEKVTNGQFAALTPDEVQVFGDGASDVVDDLDIALTDGEALDIVTLFREQGINAPDELQVYLEDPNTVVPSDIPDDVLAPLFIDFDPTQLLPNLP
jgi:hypothetical protein